LITYFWVDLDDEGAAEAVKNAYPQDCKPTASVVTGRKPHKRAHLYWKLIEKEADRAVIKKLNQAAAKKLRGDETAVNPSRLMRLGGSIAWPYKAGREPELTEFKAHKGRHPHAVEKLQRAFEVKSGLNLGPDEETRKKGTPFDECWENIGKPNKWHPSALGIVGHLWSDGLSEYGIMKFAPMFQQPGYTLEDTQADLQPLIDHVKRKDPRQVDEQATALEVGSDIEIAHRVNDDLARLHTHVVFSEGRVWRYAHTHWEQIPEGDLRQTAHQYDGAIFGKNSVVKLGKSRVDSILNELIKTRDAPDYFTNAPTGVNCLSGFIVIPEDGTDPTLEPHSPSHRCRHVVAGNWPCSRDEKGNSLLARLLDGCFKGDADAKDKADLLGEVLGSAVLGKGAQLMKPKAIVLKGATAENGKSQVLDLIRGLLPAGAVASIPLGKMGDEKYASALAGKLLNASDELTSAAAVASDTFKQVVTGEPITARDVYQSPVTFRPMAQHIFAANDLPSFRGGMDRGVQRRLLVLTFNRTIPEAERVEHLGGRVATEETDLLLGFAVKGAQRLLKQRFFTEPPSSKDALKEWLFGSDPVRAGREQGAKLDPDAETLTRRVYAAFVTWCQEEGYRDSRLPAVNAFVARVLAAEKGITRKRTRTGRFLVGVKVGALQ